MNIDNATSASLRCAEAARKIGEALAELRAAQADWLKTLALDSSDPVESLVRYAYSARAEHPGGPLSMSNISDITRREAALYLASHFGQWAGERSCENL